MLSKLADQMLGTRISGPRSIAQNKPRPAIHEYLSNEIHRGTRLGGDLYNTQELEESEYTDQTYDNVSYGTGSIVGLRELCDATSLSDLVQIVHPEAQYSKAYLRLERCEAFEEQSPRITWNISIGLSNYVRGAAATKILLENMHSMRIGTMIFPLGHDGTMASILFDEWKTQAYQDDRGPTFQTRGYLSQGNVFDYRHVARWFQSASNNIQEHNEYLDRRGYSGTWMPTKPIERIDKLSIQLFAHEQIPVPLRQMMARISATTIGAGGSTITIITGPDYDTCNDPFICQISGFRTTSAADNATCGVINRISGWHSADDGTGLFTLKDFTTSMVLRPYTRIDLGAITFVGVPVLDDTQVLIMPHNVAVDLELTVRLNK